MLLHLDDKGILNEIHSINSHFFPVTLNGDFMALMDDISKTLIYYNWQTDEYAYLDDGETRSTTVVSKSSLTPSTIIVVRVWSVHLYTRPRLLYRQTHTPIATHSFNWLVGGVSTPSPGPKNTLSIFFRYYTESDNPCRSLELYNLSSFPPINDQPNAFSPRTSSTFRNHARQTCHCRMDPTPQRH